MSDAGIVVAARLTGARRNRPRRSHGHDLDVEEWIADQIPYPGYGDCRAAVCPELARSPLGLCQSHGSAYQRQASPGGAALPARWVGFELAGRPVPVRYDDEEAFHRWCRRADPISRSGVVNLRGLTPLAKAEIKWGMFAHTQTAQRADWSLGWVQQIADACRDLECLADLDAGRFGLTGRNAVNEILAALRLIYLTPSDTRERGYLEFGHFGAEFKHRHSRFDLTAVSQRWLRDLLWDQTAAQVRSPQGPRSRNPYDAARRACVALSGFLEGHAPQGGHDPALLTEEHAHAFAADLRRRATHGLASLGSHRSDGRPSIVTDKSRHSTFNYVRKILRWSLETGEADRLGLARSFVVALPNGGGMIHRSRSPFTDEVAQALASARNLELLDALDTMDRGIRDIWETIIATGRRCREVIDLRLDCVGRYNGLPLLWHDQTKVGNYDEAIRIPDSVYQRLRARQVKTLARFESHHGRPPTAAERATLVLFPSGIRNLSGTKPISYTTFHTRFAGWVHQLDLGSSCVAHQARHTLATRLLAHGAGLHHIKRYLGHVSIRMAEHYAKITTSEIEDVLQHIWVAGPGAEHPGELLSAPAAPLGQQHAQSLAIDLSRASTPTEGGFCTFQPVVDGGSCPWNLNCTGCDKFVMSGADLLYWRRKREQWTSIAERAPDDATADFLRDYFAPTGRAIDGLEKALASFGLLDDALALDLRRPQDYFHRLWSLSFRATDLADTDTAHEGSAS